MRGLACSLALAALSCSPAGSVQTSSDPGQDTLDTRNPTLRVMTRNLYLGTDLLPVLAAPDLQTLVITVGQQYAGVQRTNFPERARAIASEIAATQPHLVALEECALWRTQTPADGPATPATHVDYDFLQILLVALARQGQLYVPVSISTNTDVELTGAFPTGLMDVRFTDRDVILARVTPGLLVTHSSNSHFSFNLTVQTVAGAFTSLRGWTAVDGYLAGHPFHFVETHLEAFADPIRDIQAQELLAGPAAVSGTLVLAADFNFDDASGPYALYTTTGGLTDAWRAANDGDPGFSCCQNGDLLNSTSLLNDRIDLVFFRGPLTAAAAELVGDQPSDRTPSGLWPSDHAGVAASLRF